MRPTHYKGVSCLVCGLLLGSALLYAQAEGAETGDTSAQVEEFGQKDRVEARAIELDGIAVVAELYAYEEWLSGLTPEERVQEYHTLEPVATDCDQPRARLKVALLVSGIEPELIDYPLARKLLKCCLDKVQGPIVTGYIRTRLDAVERQEREQRALEVASQKLVEAHQQNAILQDRIKTLEAKIEALADIEQSLQEREQKQ